MSLIIVIGIENVPDRSSRTGWSQRAYVRKVSSIESIEDRETVWSGELRWTDGDFEGRFSAGWAGPHGLIIGDREFERRIAEARAALRCMEAAIKLAEKGHKSQEWDDVAQEWVTVTTPASDEEVAAGLEAMEAIDGVREWLESATVRIVDGKETSAQLAALRAQQKKAKEEAAAAGNVDAMPTKVRDLIKILEGCSDSIIGVRYNGELYWQKGTFGRHYSATKGELRPYIAVLAQKAAGFNRSSWDDAARERFRKFWS